MFRVGSYQNDYLLISVLSDHRLPGHRPFASGRLLLRRYGANFYTAIENLAQALPQVHLRGNANDVRARLRIRRHSGTCTGKPHRWGRGRHSHWLATCDQLILIFNSNSDVYIYAFSSRRTKKNTRCRMGARDIQRKMRYVFPSRMRKDYQTTHATRQNSTGTHRGRRLSRI